jgi:transglutaminase-like putative cysteine protease
MTVFAVHHTTTYRYKNPIRPGLHQLMFRPRDSFDQRLLDCHLKISPEPTEMRWIHDVFGNCVTLVDFATKTKSLKFESIIRLEHTPENAPDFRIEDYARSHPFSYAEGEYPDLAAYIRRDHPNDVRVGMVGQVRDAGFEPTHWTTSDDIERSDSGEFFIQAKVIARDTNPGQDNRNPARHMQRLRVTDDGSGALVGFCRPLCHRIRLRTGS